MMLPLFADLFWWLIGRTVFAFFWRFTELVDGD